LLLDGIPERQQAVDNESDFRTQRAFSSQNLRILKIYNHAP